MMKSLGKTIAVLAGLLALSAVPLGNASAETVISVTQMGYDAAGRLQCTAVRMNPSTYNPASSTLPDACTLGTPGSYGNDRITYTVLDAAGQVTEVDQAYGITTANGFPQNVQRAYARYSYNPNGTKATEMDANGNKTMYVYDGFDRLSQIQYPSTSVGSGNIDVADYEQFQYDVNGNKTSWQRRNGKTISYGYDNLNRELTRAVSDGSVQTVYTGYDLLSHVLYARFGSTGGAGITNVYDGVGRLSTATDMNGRAISYQYDSASNRTQLTYPDGNWEPYTYDADNRVTTSGLGSGNYYISYDGLGHVTSVARGINAAAGAVNYGYDQVGRLTSEAQTLAGTAYNVTWNWTLNPANQIISTAASSTAYDYVETASTTVANTYDGLNRDAALALTSAACPSGGYDGNGNLICDGTRTFTYDVYNRLLTTTGNGANLNLVYDPLGRLAKYSADGGATFTSFLYDGTNLISEYDNSGNVAERYVFGPGTDQPLIWFQGSQNTTPLYFVQDYHGSVIGYADASGNLQDLYKYGPYGEPKNAGNWTSFAGARFRYTGQMVIPEASLYYYKARVYDPIFGRFLQTDPIGSKDDLDLYAYTADDPIDHADPAGTQTTYNDVTYRVPLAALPGLVFVNAVHNAAVELGNAVFSSNSQSQTSAQTAAIAQSNVRQRFSVNVDTNVLINVLDKAPGDTAHDNAQAAIGMRQALISPTAAQEYLQGGGGTTPAQAAVKLSAFIGSGNAAMIAGAPTIDPRITDTRAKVANDAAILSAGIAAGVTTLTSDTKTMGKIAPPGTVEYYKPN